jgi:hypothetical protein
MENIITRMMAVPKGAGTARLKAELEKTIEGEGLQKFTRVYTDGSAMEERVECSVICSSEEIKIKLRWGIVKRIVITDSLSNLMAQETLNTRKNSKKTELKDLLASEEGSNLRLIWVPSYMDITSNERADTAARM